MDKKEKIKKAKSMVMTNYITSINLFLDNRKKILTAIRLGIFGSILGYVWSVFSGNMFLNILSTILILITTVVYYEFRDMSDEEKTTRKILDETLRRNYHREFKDVSEMKYVEDDDL